MLFILKPLARTLLLPPASLLLIAAVGLMLLRRRPRTGKALIAFGVAALWVLATPAIADALLRVAERYPPLDLSKHTDAQAIVVLGGGGHRMAATEYRGAAADGQLLERVSYAAFVAKQTRLPVLVSGTAEETAAMRDSLARSFDTPVRWIENRSRDTYENAQFATVLLKRDGITHILLVTSSTHAWRATQEFKSAGLEVTPAPAVLWAPEDASILRWAPTPTALQRSNSALYELIGEPMRQIFAALHVRG